MRRRTSRCRCPAMRKRLRCAASRSTASRRTDSRAQGPAAIVALARGVHSDRARLSRPPATRSRSEFPLRPMRVEFAGDGWQAGGISDNRLLTETLSLARARDNASAAPLARHAAVRAVRARRARHHARPRLVDLDERAPPRAAKKAASRLSVPALAGEHVATRRHQDRRTASVTAAIADGEAGTGWSSTLDKGDTLTLTAPALTDRAEVWRITVEPDLACRSERRAGRCGHGCADKNDFRRFRIPSAARRNADAAHHQARSPRKARRARSIARARRQRGPARIRCTCSIVVAAREPGRRAGDHAAGGCGSHERQRATAKR